VPWSQLVNALKSDPIYKFVSADVDSEAMFLDLQMYLDHYKTGHVVCHRLADFVGTDPLKVALQKYLDQSM
jgi:hypothetical protein